MTTIEMQPADLELLIHTLLFFAGIYILACLGEWILEIWKRGRK